MPSRDEIYHKSPAFVLLTFADGAVIEQAFQTRIQAEAFVALIPVMQVDADAYTEHLREQGFLELLDNMPEYEWWLSIRSAILRPARFTLN